MVTLRTGFGSPFGRKARIEDALANERESAARAKSV